jgi:hypothetical protein
MKLVKKHRRARQEGSNILRNSELVSTPSSVWTLTLRAVLAKTVCLYSANSKLLSSVIIAASDVITHKMRDTTAILAECTIVPFVIRANPPEDDANNATAMPQAVIIVLKTSTYMFRLLVLDHLKPWCCALDQKSQIKTTTATANIPHIINAQSMLWILTHAKS